MSHAEWSKGQTENSQAESLHDIVPLTLQPCLQGLQKWLGATSLNGLIATRMPGRMPSLSLHLGARLSQSAAEVGSPIRGLPPRNIEGSPLSPPLMVPTHVEVDGSAFLGLPGLDWDKNSGMAKLGTFPVGGHLMYFLPMWKHLASDPWILEIIH